MTSSEHNPFLDLEIDLGDLGKWPLRLAMVPHEGKLEIKEVFLRTPHGDSPLPALDLLADALDVSLDERLLNSSQ